MTPVVSIIICTRNRAESLREALAAIGRCEVPRDLPAELLVVDNGSTDDTRQVVESTRLANMPVRYAIETRPGKGYAYNRALAETTGQVLLFTDDDVVRPGSDRLVDAVVAYGTTDAIAARLNEHLDAGADHVAVQVLNPDPLPALRALADQLQLARS